MVRVVRTEINAEGEKIYQHSQECWHVGGGFKGTDSARGSTLEMTVFPSVAVAGHKVVCAVVNLDGCQKTPVENRRGCG
jgi:hypothetical protein